MSEARVREIVRQFPENGMKLLLQHPDNLREVLALVDWPEIDQILLDQLAVDPTQYVTADYRHVASDLVLTVPRRSGKRKKPLLWLTILIEHQSEPDRLMLLRVLDYLVQIWKKQVRDWGNEHGSFASVRLRPVLPIVFYTGVHAWEQIGRLQDLMDQADVFTEVTPAFKPLFVNLPTCTAERLHGSGPFGQVLQLVQQRRASKRTFRGLLEQVVGDLEAIPDADRLRWLELLSYVNALVYHERESGEHADLEARIEASVRTDPHRQEVRMVKQTMAQVLQEKGAQQGEIQALQRTLVRQLQERFNPLPEGVEQTIRNTTDLDRLDEWLVRFATATTLQELRIPTS